VHVVEQRLEVDGRLMVAPLKTTAGVRTLVLPQFLVEVMVEHIARYSERGPAGLVFVMPEGTPLRRANFRSRVWLLATSAVGMEGFRFHDLRHTNATLAAASGALLVALMARLGHASAAAANRYQHKIEGQDETVADFLELVGAPPNPSDRYSVTSDGVRAAPHHPTDMATGDVSSSRATDNSTSKRPRRSPVFGPADAGA